MKRGYIFTLVFMLIVAFAFATVLAVANYLAQPSIQANAETAKAEALLYAFGVDVPAGTAPETLYAEQIKEVTTDTLTYYERTDASGNAAGYAVPYTGSGLWGAIRGFIAVTPDLQAMQGIAFLEQNETPGLGGRIGELWFRDQFRGQSLAQPVAYGEGIDAVTGATASSTAVIKIINDTVAGELNELEAIINGQ